MKRTKKPGNERNILYLRLSMTEKYAIPGGASAGDFLFQNMFILRHMLRSSLIYVIIQRKLIFRRILYENPSSYLLRPLRQPAH